MGQRPYGIDPGMLAFVASELRSLYQGGVEIAVVMGGGNIFRGLRAREYGVGRVAADQMGMLATMLNGIALKEALERMNVPAVLMTALEMPQIAEPYTVRKAREALAGQRVLLLGGGTGNPFFTTDTAAALRALELKVRILVKATKVDGVYDRDPVQDPELRPYARISHEEVIRRRLGVMDLTAVSLAMENGLPLAVLNLRTQGNLLRLATGQPVGTLVVTGGAA